MFPLANVALHSRTLLELVFGYHHTPLELPCQEAPETTEELEAHGHVSEEDIRATTNVQNGLVFFFLFSFILFSSL